MKNLVLFLFFCSLLFGNYAFAQTRTLTDEDLSSNAHTLFNYERTVVSVQKVNQLKIDYEASVTILNDKSPFENVVVGYDEAFEEVSMKTITILDANGKVIETIKPKAIFDVSNSDGFSIAGDSRAKYAKTRQLTYPYTIVYSYQKTSKMTMFYPSWHILHHYGVAVKESAFEVEVPAEINLRYQPYNTNIEPIKLFQGNNNVSYKFEAKAIPAMLYEPLSPASVKVLPFIRIAPDKFGMDEYKGDMSSWQSLGLFNYELNKGRDVVSQEMATTVKNLINGIESKEEKIKVLYRYLQENMRYVSIQLGIGGWQTFDAQYVEKNKYGDCKALSNFMKSMLKVADIEAYVALVLNGESKIDQIESFPAPAFNHVILYIPSETADEEGIWLECTSNDLPVGIIGYGNEDRFALIIKPTGGELIRTPKSTKSDNQLSSTAQLALSADGTANIDIQQVAKGNRDGYYRYYALNGSEDEKEKCLRKKLDLPNFSFNNLVLTPNKEKHETSLELSIKVPKYATKSGKRIFLNPNITSRVTEVPADVPNRKTPIEEEDDFFSSLVVTLSIPSGFKLEAMPKEPIVIDSKFGKYEASFELKDNHTLIYKRTAAYNEFFLPKEEYNNYRDFVKEIVKADNTKIILVAE